MDSQEEVAPSRIKRTLTTLKEIIETVVVAILIALVVNIFLVRATRVFGQSMEPNLHTNQRLVVEKLSYNPYLQQYLNFDGPERGDIVVLHLPEQNDELLIKRIIGLPGDTISIRNGSVLVNGERLAEPYINQATRGRYGPTVIPSGHLFVLGDNRNFSNDSRSFGPVSMADVVGRAWFSYWPMDEIGFVE